MYKASDKGKSKKNNMRSYIEIKKKRSLKYCQKRARQATAIGQRILLNLGRLKTESIYNLSMKWSGNLRSRVCKEYQEQCFLEKLVKERLLRRIFFDYLYVVII